MSICKLADLIAFYSVGRPKHERVMFTANEMERFIGKNAVSRKYMVKHKFPT